MKHFAAIIIVIVLFIISGRTGYSQEVTPAVDTLRLRQRTEQSATTENGQSAQGKGNMQQTGKNNANKQVKQIRNGRPDMSRARGARPPSVVRPSGSVMPRGVGRPGGAGRKGGR
jgi:hypothetical protein